MFVAHVGFEGGTVVLIAPVPDHCLPFTFDLKHQEEHFKADRFNARRECLSGHVICYPKKTDSSMLFRTVFEKW